MTQRTVKTVLEALQWIDTTPHHYASVEEKGFLILGNHDDRVRIPAYIVKAMDGLYEPGGKLDARMFRPTKAGQVMLGQIAAHGEDR